jgi:Rha family phage regulatory protein
MLQNHQIPMSSTSKYVELINGKPTTTSLIVAKAFDKRHPDVLKAIDALEIPNDFKESNFSSVEIIEQNASGGQYKKRLVHIAEEGAMFLIMGFTGKNASYQKMEFIRQFKDMKTQLQAILKQQNALPAPEPVQTIRLDRVLSEEEYVDLMRFKIQTLERQNRDQQEAIQAAGRVEPEPERRYRRPVTEEEKARVVALYNQGLSARAIADRVGRHRDTIIRILDNITGPSGMIDLTPAIEPGDECQTNGASWRAA